MKRESVEKAAQERKEQTFAAIIAEMTQAIGTCIKARMFLAGNMLMYRHDDTTFHGVAAYLQWATPGIH